ncbi:Scale keratin, partial [Mesitornis unicolor]
SVSSRCLPQCEVTCPQPCVYGKSLGPCVATCGDSTAVVYAPPVLLTFPGAILQSCPQESIVGASFPQQYGALTSGSSSDMLGSYGSGGSSGMGGSSGSGSSFGYGGSSGMGGSSGSGSSFGYGG